MRKKTYEELGKASINIAVAWIIFGIIQPVFSGKVSVKFSIIAGLGFLMFALIGSILLEMVKENGD